MRKRTILPYALLVLTAGIIFPEVFRFKFTKGEMFKYINEVSQKITFNDKVENRSEILNKVSIEVIEVKGTSGYISAVYTVSERGLGDYEAYKVADEIRESKYWIDERGKFTMDDVFLYPNVRDIPLFPQKNIEAGDSWKDTGLEVHDLVFFGLKEPVKIPIDVSYTYLRKEKIKGIDVAVFFIKYTSTLSLKNVPEPGYTIPLKISGTAEQIYYWDIKRGRPFSYQDKIMYAYFLSNGDIMEIEWISSGTVIQTEEFDKDKAVEDIQNEIDKEKLEDVTVKEDEEGVTITLENIQFMPDSAELLPSEKEKLEKIASILKKYPERDLLIVGHTAFAGIEYGLQELSEKRARAVAEFLLSLGVREPEKIIYLGRGPDEPIADNSTEEGRKKNRRVEIKILEN